MIDWTSDETHLLLNPRLPEDERRRLEQLSRVISLRAHVWIATSGSSGALKLVALSKQALLISAQAVNDHLGATFADPWCCVLPTFHVGGLGIHARTWINRAKLISIPWDPREFTRVCEEERIAFSSLVPAQVVDLVRGGLRAPQSVRGIVVGGGALAPPLHDEARALGWPLLPSYGMTECCSQVATATRDSAELQLLPHFDGRVTEDGRLAFRGLSLLTGYAVGSPSPVEPPATRRRSAAEPAAAPPDMHFIDPKVDGWFVSEDVGEIERRVLRVKGRRGDTIKIGGELVDLARLDRILGEIAGADAAVVAMDDERLGSVIHLAVTRDGERIREAFNARVLPFERAREVHAVDVIPRSPLGKLLRSQLAGELRRR